jgi:hypothetical protein
MRVLTKFMLGGIRGVQWWMHKQDVPASVRRLLVVPLSLVAFLYTVLATLAVLMLLITTSIVLYFATLYLIGTIVNL